MRKALVIDDIKSNRIFMANCLQEEDYSVTSVGNGIDALKSIQDCHFDVIFLDMRLPGMSGMQILKWMKENLIRIPVAVVTAFGTVNNAIECLENGVIAYIRKPLSAERFKKCIADINGKLKDFRPDRSDILQKASEEADKIDTFYAPALKIADDVILSQSERILKNKILTDLFNIIPSTILVLNKERQIIYSNQYFLEVIGINSEASLGLRPGEILNCIHAYQDTNGCGTTECCSVCGAVKAIVEAQRTKMPVQKECLMNYRDGETVLSRELSISVTPADHILEGATIFIVRDISDEKLRANMERILFHDLLNTSGAIKGMAEYAEKSPDREDKNKYISYINESANYLIDEIVSHKIIVSAEKSEIGLNLTEFSVTELIQSVVRYYEAADCEFELQFAGDLKCLSDRALMHRVIMNMVKNAVEAPENKIRISALEAEGFIDISVHNRSYISKEIQLQIFKKFFSTKGSGRGIGTYSMKLIGEGLLKGKVWFASTPASGTVFTLRVPKILNNT
jgi:CheY-like chemotaxis protein